MSDLNIVIRVMPNGDEFDVEVPNFSTGKDLVDGLLQKGVAPRNDPQGNPYIYELISKGKNVKISETKTLMDVGISNGDTIYFTPKLVAG